METLTEVAAVIRQEFTLPGILDPDSYHLPAITVREGDDGSGHGCTAAVP